MNIRISWQQQIDPHINILAELPRILEIESHVISDILIPVQHELQHSRQLVCDHAALRIGLLVFALLLCKMRLHQSIAELLF